MITTSRQLKDLIRNLSRKKSADALAATAKKRGTLQQIQDAGAVFDEIEESSIEKHLEVRLLSLIFNICKITR